MARPGDLKINGHVVAQRPNPPLWAAIIGGIVALIADDGTTLDDLARSLFYIGLVAWAYLELTEGVNAWRHFLGIAGLAFAFVSLAIALS